MGAVMAATMEAQGVVKVAVMEVAEMVAAERVQ